MIGKDILFPYEIENELKFFSDEDFGELLERNFKDSNIEGKVVTGKVISLDNDVAVIDVGLKSEGVVPIREFSDNLNAEFIKSDFDIGDDIEVYVERIEGRDGKTTLSRENAVRETCWTKLEQSCEEGQTVEGVIMGRIKGGFTVNVQGVIAFLPGSQVDIRPVKDITPLMGISQPFTVLKIDRVQGNIIVSRRAILEESRIEERVELLSKIQEGQVMKGVIKNITDYGAFIDLGSVDGLLHVTDISWGRINHPSEILSLGQEVDVKVIKYNKDTKRISLGMKQLDNNPWKGLEGKYVAGTETEGFITNIADYGAFVEIEKGIEGLVHISEISWTKNNVHPRRLLAVGQKVKVQILEIDVEKHRISLGIKQCTENPWKKFTETYSSGSIVSGEIKNIVEFGLFIGFDGGIDGLVHISDISWDENGEEALKSFSKGDIIKVKVLIADYEKQRISLGIKQLERDNIGEIFDELKKDSLVTCNVVKVSSDGIEVSIKDVLSSFIKKSDLSRDRVEQRPERFTVGNRVDAKVIMIDAENRKLQLSIKALENDMHKKAIEDYGSADSGASLENILGSAIDKANKKKNN
ncbi:MAG: 30S ribosomal protein S1 [Pseudomonadota bacterium]